MDSLSRLRHLGIYENNDPEKPGYEYRKSTFDTDKNTVCSVNSNQNVNNKFEIHNSKYCINEKDLTNLQSTDTHTVNTNSVSCMYNLDPTIINQLQQQDMFISKIIDKGKSKKNDKTTYYLDEHDITYRKTRDGPNIFSHNYGL